jgi:hypothetical protein
VAQSISELLRMQLQDQSISPDLVSLVSLPAFAGENDFFSVVHDFSVMLHLAATHSPGVTCTSAVLCYRDQPIVSFTGPVEFDSILFAKLCQAPFVVCWANNQPSARRAAFHDVVSFSDKVNAGRRQEERVVFLVGGYGSPQEAPLLTGYVTLLQQGSPIVLVAGEFVQSPFAALNLPLPNVRKTHPMRYPASGKTTMVILDPAVSERPPTGPTQLTAAALQQTAARTPAYNPVDSHIHTDFEPEREPVKPGAYDTRKIFVFTNEDKGSPGKLLLLKNFRNLAQISQRVAQIFSLKPIKELYYGNGVVVKSMDELYDGCELIAVRRGGAPYNPNDLPRLMKSAPKSSRGHQ